MGIQTATLLEGATVSATGGTVRTLAPISASSGQATMFVDSDTSLVSRRTIVATVKQPKRVAGANSEGVQFTQARSRIVVRYPKVLANGYVTINSVTIEVSTDVETTAAERHELRNVGAQLLFDADFTSFWDNLSTV